MRQLLEVGIPQFQTLLVILVRVAGMISAWPVLGSRAVAPQIKVGLVLMLGLVLLPIVRVPRPPDDPVLLAAGLVAEFLLGLVFGLGTRLLFAGIELAGEIMGVQMGLGAVQLFDPTAAHQIPLISNFQMIMASLIFLSLNAHLIVVEAVARSFEIVPPFGAGLSPELVEDVLRVSQGMFLIALKLAAPVLATILLLNLALAILGRAVPQMNVFILSFPLTIGGGLLVMGLALPFTVEVFGSELIRVQERIGGLLQMMTVNAQR